MTVDDYGRFYADPRLLKANCFPLLLDTIREADISRWMAECQKAGLIVLYESKGKRYLQIEDFRQRLDRAREKYPPPTPESVLPELGNEFPAESQTNPNPKQESQSQTESPAFAEFDAFLLSFNSITGRAFKGGKKEKGALRARLADGYTLDQIARAVSYCFNDPYHREHPNYLTPEFILRPDKLEKYLNYIIPINNGTESKSSSKAEFHSQRTDQQLRDLITGTQ